MASLMIRNREVKQGLLEDPKYQYLFTQVTHTHEGSIGILCNSKIAAEMNKLVQNMNFAKVDRQIEQLLNS